MEILGVIGIDILGGIVSMMTLIIIGILMIIDIAVIDQYDDDEI